MLQSEGGVLLLSEGTEIEERFVQYGDTSAQPMVRLTLDRFRPVYESLPMLTFLEGKLLVFHSVQLLVVPMTSSSARLAWQAVKI